MNRRAAMLTIAGGMLGSRRGLAQAGTRKRIGVLVFTRNDPFLNGFKRALKDVGYEEGRNLEIVYRDGQGRSDLIEKGARELVEAKVDAIVVWSTAPGQAVMRATKTIPIVVQMADPLSSGLVHSLARPEANITGISTIAFDIAGKRVDLLMELLPRVKTMAFIGLAGEVNVQRFLGIVRSRARPGIEVRSIEIKSAAEAEAALAAGIREGVEAAVFQQIFDPDNGALGAVVKRLRLPAVGGQRSFVEGGGLLSLGVDSQEAFRGLARYVERILAGTPVANLPVQQVTRTVMAINLQSARQLSLAIPQTMLASADEVVD
jgi:putative ABC transport system substrate-binding protein